MKFMLISDNHDTLTGMRLAGIEGVVVSSAEEAESMINKFDADRSVGIILLTEKAAAYAPGLLKEKKLHSGTMYLEIPDRHGSQRGDDAINQYIRDAVGISI